MIWVLLYFIVGIYLGRQTYKRRYQYRDNCPFEGATRDWLTIQSYLTVFTWPLVLAGRLLTKALSFRND